MQRDDLTEIEGALQTQLSSMGYAVDSDMTDPRGQFSIYSSETDEWWVVTILDECEEGDVELARHFSTQREDRLGYFELADPACFSKMDAHIQADKDAPPPPGPIDYRPPLLRK